MKWNEENEKKRNLETENWLQLLLEKQNDDKYNFFL